MDTFCSVANPTGMIIFECSHFLTAKTDRTSHRVGGLIMVGNRELAEKLETNPRFRNFAL